jgi:hypothetical protein
MGRIFWFALTIISFSLGALDRADAQNTLWVKGADAKLKADHTASSQTLTTLSIGETLSVLGTEGRWYKVATKLGRTGWIYRGKVSDRAPAPTQDGGKSAVGDLFSSLGSSEISAAASDSSRSIRGLSPEAKEYAEQVGASIDHQKALNEVLHIQISDAELERFLENGQIGEYAR